MMIKVNDILSMMIKVNDILSMMIKVNDILFKDSQKYLKNTRQRKLIFLAFSILVGNLWQQDRVNVWQDTTLSNGNVSKKFV